MSTYNEDVMRIASAIAGKKVKRLVVVSTGYSAKPPGIGKRIPYATNRYSLPSPKRHK